eukprot:m.443824 g.443824  ORF g.443824 m.443824 type:complete len:61 (-) comp139036_c0_seq1:448-630(-)
MRKKKKKEKAMRLGTTTVRTAVPDDRIPAGRPSADDSSPCHRQKALTDTRSSSTPDCKPG